FPRFVSEFARTRDGVETPELFAGANVERARIAWSWLAAFGTRKTKNDNVTANCGSGGLTVVDAVEIGVHAFPAIDCTRIAEAGIQEAGLRVGRDQSAIGDTEKNARQFAIGPIGDAAIDAAGGARLTPHYRGVGVVFPTLAAGVRIERDDFGVDGGNE